MRGGVGGTGRSSVCYTPQARQSVEPRLGFIGTDLPKRGRGSLGPAPRRACTAALWLALVVPLGCRTQAAVEVEPTAPAESGETSPTVFEPQAQQIAAIPGAQLQRESDRLVVFFSGDELFESGTARLAPAAAPLLHDFAQSVRSAPDARLAVRAYTDAQGSESFNLTLSEDRADSVRRFLVSEGIEPGHVSAAGFGPQFPVASNDTPEGRRMNRRIEIELRPAPGAIGGLQSSAPEPR